MGVTATNGILLRFGCRVRELRKGRGWSQEAFARECGLDRSYVGGVERGSRNITLVNVDKIAKALGVGVGQLFGDTEQPEHESTPAVTTRRGSGTHG